MVRVRAVLPRDCCYMHERVTHLRSQMFMSLVVVLNDQFCREVIGRQDLKSCSDWAVVVLLRLQFDASIVCQFHLRLCMSRL